MERIRILCYGDSNTWGYIPASNHKRYSENERWTKLLSRKLGSKFEVIEEGLSGRTLISDDDEGKNFKRGIDGLLPVLNTHDPLNLVILMLGTNELKTVNNRTAKEIGSIIDDYFVKTILSFKCRTNNIYPKLLLICPPIVNEEEKLCKEWGNFIGAYEKSLKLKEIYKSIAEKNECYYIDNEGLETGIDGIHLTVKGHQVLAHKVYDIVNKIYKEEELWD